MSTENQELLEKAVVNLTIENAKSQLQIIKLKEDNENLWRWYGQKKDLLEKMEKDFERLKIQKEKIIDQNQFLRRNLNGSLTLNGVSTEEEETE